MRTPTASYVDENDCRSIRNQRANLFGDYLPESPLKTLLQSLMSAK
jgi:hypothetical protein